MQKVLHEPSLAKKEQEKNKVQIVINTPLFIMMLVASLIHDLYSGSLLVEILGAFIVTTVTMVILTWCRLTASPLALNRHLLFSKQLHLKGWEKLNNFLWSPFFLTVLTPPKFSLSLSFSALLMSSKAFIVTEENMDEAKHLSESDF